MQGESGIRIPDAVKDAPRNAVPALVSGFDVRVADWRLLSAVNRTCVVWIAAFIVL